jgi:hypothetical protein
VTISLGINTLVVEGWEGDSVVGRHLWQRSQDEVARCSCSGFWSRSPSATKITPNGTDNDGVVGSH